MITPLLPNRGHRLTAGALMVLATTWLGGCATTWLGGCATSQPPAPAPAQAAPTLVGPGQPLPLQQLTDLDGNTIRLDTPGQKKLIVLFATWCGDSQRAMKALNASPLLDKDITIVAVAREQQVDEVRQWQRQTGYRIPLAVDPDRSIYRQFAQSGIPRFITVDGDNRVIGSVLAEGQAQLSTIRW